MPKPPPPPANRGPNPSPALQRAVAALQMGQIVEAERLATLLDGQRISSPYTSALASGKSLSP